jgi:p-aminobenzoyl-glutamate transporter AbgT
MSAFGDCIGHCFDMTVRGVINNQNLSDCCVLFSVAWFVYVLLVVQANRQTGNPRREMPNKRPIWKGIAALFHVVVNLRGIAYATSTKTISLSC